MNKGPMSASSDRFFITIGGKSSHGSAPETGVDAVVIGAQVITALQSIVSRAVSPLDNVVLTIGKVTAGSRYNIIEIIQCIFSMNLLPICVFSKKCIQIVPFFIINVSTFVNWFSKTVIII